MNSKQEELIKLTPELVKLVAKVIRFSRGGFTFDERKELAGDLLILVDHIMDGVI